MTLDIVQAVVLVPAVCSYDTVNVVLGIGGNQDLQHTHPSNYCGHFNLFMYRCADLYLAMVAPQSLAE